MLQKSMHHLPFAWRPKAEQIGLAMLLAAAAANGCGIAARTVTISVAREVDGEASPLLEERPILVFPYAVWHQQREEAKDRLADIEARLEERLEACEGDADPTEAKVERVLAAFDRLRQYCDEVGWVVPAVKPADEASGISFSRGGLAARLARRQAKLDFLATLKSQYAAIRSDRHALIAVQALRSPPETFQTNASGFVTIPMAVFTAAAGPAGGDSDDGDPEAAAMTNKWIVATVVEASEHTTLPSLARAVVAAKPKNKYRLIVGQSDP